MEEKIFQRRLMLAAASVSASLLSTSSLMAAYTWNPTPNVATSALDGIWKTSGSAIWNNGTTNVAWTDSNAAIFAGSDTGGAVSVGSALSPTSIAFSNSGYTLSAASAFTVTTPLVTVASTKSATIGTNVKVTVSGIGVTGTNQGTLNIVGGSVTSAATYNVLGNGMTINVGDNGTLSSGSSITLGNTVGDVVSLVVNSATAAVTTSLANGNLNLAGSNVASGTSTVTLTNGAITLASVNAGGGQLNFGAGSSGVSTFFNLDGGTLTTQGVVDNSADISTFNFNGGVLKANTSAVTTASGTFMALVNNTIIKAGGAKIDTNGLNITIATALTNGAGVNGTLTKLGGSGTLLLTGANSYTGLTDVQVGTLALNGSAVGKVTGGLSVESGATFAPTASASGVVTSGAGTYTVGAGKSLSGAGTITGTVDASAAGATISPGDSGVGKMSIQGGLAFGQNSILNFDVASTSSYDQILLTSANSPALTLDGTLNITGTLALGQYTLISGYSTLNDQILNISNVAPAGRAYGITYGAGNVYLNVTSTPEPASMLALIASGISVLRRRSKK